MSETGIPCAGWCSQKKRWLIGLPRWRSGKESACQSRRCKRCGLDPWVRKITWSRRWQPTPVFLPGESHGRGAWQATESQRVRHDWAPEHSSIARNWKTKKTGRIPDTVLLTGDYEGDGGTRGFGGKVSKLPEFSGKQLELELGTLAPILHYLLLHRLFTFFMTQSPAPLPRSSPHLFLSWGVLIITATVKQLLIVCK